MLRRYFEYILIASGIEEENYEKFMDAGNRYAWIIREQFRDGYVKKALRLAKERQEKINV